MASVPRKYLANVDRIHPDLLQFAPVTRAFSAAPLPPFVDLRSKMPCVYDQGQLGSCTANAFVGAYQFLTPQFMGSRLFLYFNERRLEGSTSVDAGAYIYDGAKAIKTWGLCPESDLPYDVTKFAAPPSARCYMAGLKHRAVSMQNVYPDSTSIKRTLAGGIPITVGILVFASFETAQVARTGVVPMPTAGDPCLGGHAILCVGYDDVKQRWIMRNSWGPYWGDRGYFYLPYQYLLDPSLSSDFWVINSSTH